MLIKKIVLVVWGICMGCFVNAQPATGSYVNDLRNELVKTWPNNRTINIVFHGHSVPSGYANTPVVNTLNAYPHLTLHALKEHYPPQNTFKPYFVIPFSSDRKYSGASFENIGTYR